MTRISILLAAAVVGAAAAPAFAATPTPPAEAHVLILAPLTFTNIDDLDFGTVVSSGTAGTVTINALTGARTRTGGVTLMSSGAVAAAFSAEPIGWAAGHRDHGPADRAGGYSGSRQHHPGRVDALDNGNVTATRTIDTITKTFFVGVGGTILVAANQPDGDYESTYFIDAQYQ